MLLSIGSLFHFQPHFPAQAKALLARLGQMRQTVIGRRAIAQMDDRMLADIGLSRSEALAEINRRPWDIAPRV